MERKLIENLLTATISSGTNSNSVNVEAFENFEILPRFADVTPAPLVFASTAVNTTADTITINSHGLVTGSVFQIATSGGLPAPLVVLTNYYVIKVDANTIQVADTLGHALAGTPINLTTQGTGNDTITATALANAKVILQGSPDNSYWFNVAGGEIDFVSGGANPPPYEYTFCEYDWVRVVFSLDSGVLSVQADIEAKLFAGS